MIYNDIIKGGNKMIVKIQTKKGEFCWNSKKCKPLLMLKNIFVLSIPFLAIAAAQTISGVEVML